MAISKRNKRGIWVLILLCVALAYVPRVLAEWNPESIEVSYEAIEQAEQKVEKQQLIAKARKKHRYTKRNKSYKSPPSKFDPNNYGREDWMYLGLSEKQAEVVLKFTSRGIRSNEELKKIYVIPEEVFELIKDSVVYPVHERKTIASNNKRYEAIVDINTASMEELKSLPGIGDFYAKKIIEQRNNLGGYAGTHQLLEIWKFDAERYDKIKDHIIATGGVEKININTADIETLKQHPYISYKVANSIVKLREAHGPYQKVQDILKSVLIDQELFSKIQPYLTT